MLNLYNNTFQKKHFFEKRSVDVSDQCREEPGFPRRDALDPFISLAKFMPPPSCGYKVSDLKNPYSKQYCEKVAKCGNTKLQASAIKEYSTFENLALFDLQTILDKALTKMERIERVKRFAELAGMKDIPNCKARFESNNNSVKCAERFKTALTDIVESVAEVNKDAKSDDSQYYYHDYVYKKRNTTPNSFNEYFNARVAHTNEFVLKNQDESNLEAISIILSDTATTQEEKEKKYHDFLHSQDIKGRLDPILSFQNDQLFNIAHKDLLKQVFSQKDISKNDIKEKLIDYRKTRMREILSSPRTCDGRLTYDNLCKRGDLISTGVKVPKNIEEAKENISSENSSPQSQNVLLRAIHKKYFATNPEPDFESARIILEASRCTSYSFNTSVPKEDIDLYYALKVAPKARIVPVDKDGNAIDDFENAPRAIPVEENTSIASDSSGPSSVTEEDIPKASVVEDFQPSSQMSTPAAIRPISSISETLDSDEASRIETQKATDAVITSGSSKEIDKRLSDLTKRLEEANARISQMASEKAKNEATAVKDQKIQEENKVIEELRSQIAELKKKKETDQTQSTAAVITPYKKPESNNNSSDSFGGSSTNTNKKAPAENKNFLPTERITSQASVGPSRSPSSINSNKQVVLDSSGKKTIEVIIDSSQLEKGVTLTEAILQKITGLNGESFYIEEGGMLKQIIPILDENGKVVLDKEGKPTYEKVTKGKTSEKLAKKDKKDEVIPLPAITTKADLQRNQDELLGRSVYQEIQKITNEVLGNEN
jgi:hypothetical protein